MAKRRFELPGIQDLSKEQEEARALATEGQHLIIGGPGTGKSVLALLRSRRLAQENKRYVFLVYNHLLNESSRQLFGGNLTSSQWQSWFMSFFRSHIKKSVPQLLPDANNWREFNWPEILALISPLDSDLPTLIIDEGQDMPPEFYQALVNFGFVNFFVMADQNQQINYKKNSSRRDIETALAIETADVIELKNNYRNKYPIARLAREFYTGDPASPPPDLPPVTSKSVKTPLCYEYDKNEFKKLVENILKTSDRDPSKLIGILTANDDDRSQYYQELLKSDVKLDNKKPIVRTYSSNDRNPVGFDEGGIVVINAQACKGLEFDIVFVADINHFSCDERSKDNTKRLFYVMVARAIDKVILLKQRGRPCAVESILPADESILERK